MHMACLVAPAFSIVTSVSRTVPFITELVQACGFGARCRRIRAAEVAVLELEEDGDAEARVREACRRAAAEDECGALVLGCSGMSHLTPALEAEVGLPVVDGVTAAVKLVEAIVGLGMRPSKVGATAFPGAKPYRGQFADFSPTRLVHHTSGPAETLASPKLLQRAPT
jgi:allantoin racemase